MKYLISLLILLSVCLQSLPAQSQGALDEAPQTSKESDDWARKIDSVIKLYAAEEPRRLIRLEEVQDYSLEELFKTCLQLQDTSFYGEKALIYQHYMDKARKAKATRHVKLAHIFIIAKGTTLGGQSTLGQSLMQYSEDDDYFVAFTALALHVRLAGSAARLNLSSYNELLDSYLRLRTLMPSSEHVNYEYYRYRDALVSEFLMVRGKQIIAIDQAQKEVKYFARELGIQSSYYDTAHNLILTHSQLYADENSIRLIRKLSDTVQNDSERSSYASYLLGHFLISQKKYKQAIAELQKETRFNRGDFFERYSTILSKAYRYSGDLKKSRNLIEKHYKSINATEIEIQNSRPMRELSFLEKTSPDLRPDAINFLIEQDNATTQTLSKAWGFLTQSHIYSLGDSRQLQETYQGSLSDTPSKTLSPTVKNRIVKVLNIYKTPNLLTMNGENDQDLNPLSLIFNDTEKTPNIAAHYLQNSDFYKAILAYDYSEALIFQTSRYSNITLPKTITRTPTTLKESLEIDIFNAFHYLYINDTKMAWKMVAKVDAEIVNSENSLAELEYQIEYLKFLLYTKEHNLFLATVAANNYVVKAIDLKRPVNESAILENLLYLLYQNNHYDEALRLFDDAPRSGKANQYAKKNIEYLKALVLTHSGQHAAALLHAQVHNRDDNTDEQESLFASLKHLNQAATGDIENANITKQVILNKLSRISNTKIQNTVHLNIASAQTYLQTENVEAYRNNMNSLATAAERIRTEEIVKLRAARDQANLQKEALVRENVNSLASDIDENKRAKNIAYLISAFSAVFASALGILYFKKRQSSTRQTTSLKRKHDESEKIYQYLSSTSKERVSAMRRIISSVKETHIDEATIHSLSVAIDEADALLVDIKGTKIRSRLTKSLDGATYSMFDPHKFRSTMLPIWMQKIKSKNVTFTFNCDANLGTFETDAEILIAAIEDVVIKAINATLFGSVSVEFNVSKKLNKHLLSINITDTGNASQIFDLDDVAVQAITALNGSLNHNCESGVGCTVKMTLPIRLASPYVKTPQNNNVISFKN